MSGNAFRGVSAEQDARFGDKEKKLLKSMAKSFPEEYKTKVDLLKVNWEAMKPWIANRLTELLGGVEDDVLIGYVYEQLEGKKEIDPRIFQINLTGFLENNTRLFCKELWTLLISAASGPSGIPQEFLDAKAEELRKREAERRQVQERIATERARRRREEEEEEKADWERRRQREVERERRRNDSSPSPERRRRYRRRSSSRDRSRDRRSPERNWNRSRRYSRQYSQSPPSHRRHRRRSPSYD